MAGYSGTPLPKKLGLKPGRACFDNAPPHFPALLGPLPDGFKLLDMPARPLDYVHLFTTQAADLRKKLAQYQRLLAADGTIWVSWPKKAAKVPTDVTEEFVRELALPLGLVDVNVCAVDEVWSGLKLVIRRVNRK